MTDETGFASWDLDRLLAQRKHLQSILLVSAGQADRPQIREEYDAMGAEITRRLTCPACLDDRHGECEDPCKCPCPVPEGERTARCEHADYDQKD